MTNRPAPTLACWPGKGFAVGLLLLFTFAVSGASGASCKPTKPDMLGPYYERNAPVRSTTGDEVTLVGTVRSSTDCSGIGKAKLEWWCANGTGIYTDDLRATQYANAQGRYMYETVYPGLYETRPIRHYHVKVSAPGYDDLITQIYPKSKSIKLIKFDFVLLPKDEALV